MCGHSESYVVSAEGPREARNSKTIPLLVKNLQPREGKRQVSKEGCDWSPCLVFFSQLHDIASKMHYICISKVCIYIYICNIYTYNFLVIDSAGPLEIAPLSLLHRVH